MSDFSAPWFFRRSGDRAIAFAAALCLCAPAAEAQTNPFRAVTDWMGMTTEAVDAPDFVRQTHPDAKTEGYSQMTGVDKKRAAVRTPAEVEADKADLVAEREKSAARMKNLGAEKMDPVAPSKAPPVTDEHF